jgi:RNA polymerase sigma factor (sigma-70 family)
VKSLTDPQLLNEYARQGSEDAFAELVHRHIDFIHSAAVRMVCDTQLAGDVTQGVFLALAQNASQLSDRAVLSGWLHRTTQNLAANAVRADVRRRAREQEAAAMNELLVPEPDAAWEDIAPRLDAALNELEEPDREALLLRYFEHKSAREMAPILGISDEAAQKRVNRAVERLRDLIAKRGVTVGAAGLLVLISTNAVQSAPAGLAAMTISTALSGTATFTSAVIATTKTIAMTTLQKTLVASLAAAFVAAIGAGLFQAHQNSRLSDQVAILQQQQAPLSEQILQLQREHDDATNRLALMTSELAKARKNPSEVLKLRGEVGQLRQEKAIAGDKSVLNKLTADPATKKLIREQQKAGMSAIYSDFVKKMKLSPDQAEKFNDLLADNVMGNIDLITQALHDGRTPAELDQIFSGADADFLQKLQALVGPDNAAQYQEFTKNLDATLTAQQFKAMMTGDDDAKAAKSDQLTQLMEQQTQSALAAAGLPADYQALPILNFRNIASETVANQNITLLDTIYGNVAAQAGSFLSPDELAKFQEFRTTAINNSRAALNMNRQMMAPVSK